MKSILLLFEQTEHANENICLYTGDIDAIIAADTDADADAAAAGKPRLRYEEKNVEILDLHHYVACIIRHPHIFLLVHVWFYAYHCLFACMAPSGLLASESFFFVCGHIHSIAFWPKMAQKKLLLHLCCPLHPLLLVTIMFSPVPKTKQNKNKKTYTLP